MPHATCWSCDVSACGQGLDPHRRQEGQRELGVLIQKRGVPTGYLEAQSRKRTRGFSDPRGAAGYFEISQLGNASCSLATPASVTLVQMRSSLFRLASPLRCINPASLIWVPSSDSYSKLFCVLWYTSPVIATVTAKSGSRQRATKRE